MMHPVDPPALLDSLRRHRLAVVFIPVLVALGAFGMSSTQPPTYVAEARILFADPRAEGVLAGGAQPRIDTASFVNQQALQVTADEVVEAAAEDLSQASVDAIGLGGTPDGPRVRRTLTVTPQPDLLAVVIAARAGTPQGAAAVADAVASATDAVLRERALAEAERGVAEIVVQLTDLQEQVDALGAQLAADPEQPMVQARLQSLVQVQLDLEARQRELTVEAAATGSGIELVEPAIAPVAPASPQPVRDAVLAALLALAATVGLAHLHASRVRVVGHRLDAQRVLGVPLLGEVPRFDADDVDGGELPPAVAEALQFVRASLEFVSGEPDSLTIAVTSATAGEGKTTLAALLALSLSSAGRPAALVDVDVRARGLTIRLGAEGRCGVADVVDRGVDPQHCLIASPSTLLRGVSFLPAGRMPDDVPGLLRSRALAKGLGDLSAAFDVVVLDTPPLLAVADAVVVSGQADVVVLVVDHGLRIGDLERLRERLTILPRPVLGYIYNRAPGRGGTYGGYGYGYGAVADDGPARPQAQAAARSVASSWSLGLSRGR